MPQYFKAISKEMELRKHYLNGEKVKTVFLGGGTPSLAPQELCFDLVKTVLLQNPEAEEVTMECNPDDITPDFVVGMVAAGVNRVSMGAQTFSDERLRFIRRRHTSSQVVKAVETLRQGGITNISIDLMFGFPGETIEEWEADIDRAISLNVEHLSAYSLMYEEGTPLYKMLEEGKIEEIDEELSRKMYYLLIDKLTAEGYEHYEISNFARPGYRSKHNSSYWQDVPYIGLGAAAHSYNGRSRQWNIDDVSLYINKVENGKVPFDSEEIDADTHYNDLITTRLRTCEGINLNTLTYRKDYLLRMAEPFINRGLLAIDNNQLHITRKGLYVSDDVMAELVYVD